MGQVGYALESDEWSDLRLPGEIEKTFQFVSKVVVPLHGHKLHQVNQFAANLIRAIRFGHAAPAVAGGCGVFHGVAGHDDSEYGGACDFGGPQGDAAEHEGGAGELYAELSGFHSDQRMDGGQVWDAAG